MIFSYDWENFKDKILLSGFLKIVKFLEITIGIFSLWILNKVAFKINVLSVYFKFIQN